MSPSFGSIWSAVLDLHHDWANRLNNYIRDEVCRFLFGGGLGLKIEPLGLLSDEPDRRPADLLTIPSALCRQTSWHVLSRIAIDFVVMSPFRMARGHLATEDCIPSKRLNRATHTRCREQGIGFEPIVFDHAGGMNEEGKRILGSLWKAVEGSNVRQAGCTRYVLQERISIALLRYISHCLMYRRAESQRNLHSLPLRLILD